jgi:hypothetical protein
MGKKRYVVLGFVGYTFLFWYLGFGAEIEFCLHLQGSPIRMKRWNM